MIATLDDFTLAYIECALWSTNTDGGEPLDANYSIDDLAAETLDKIVADCQKFQAENVIPEYHADWPDVEMAGHDFWLTRNHHGAGFWDRGLEEGDSLTEAADSFGEVDLYVGDDGLIYS